jgi:hypothetical protein
MGRNLGKEGNSAKERGLFKVLLSLRSGSHHHSDQDINAAVEALEAEREAEREAAEAAYDPLAHATLDELDEFEVSSISCPLPPPTTFHTQNSISHFDRMTSKMKEY